MNAKQKKFILEKLCPFILREQGRGFIMQHWSINTNSDKYYYSDKIGYIKSPQCGTVCCIGGSIDILTKCKIPHDEVMGLPEEMLNGLFYGFDGHDECAWPDKYVLALENAKTPLAAAKVAVKLLHEVVKTNGQCLKRKSRNSVGLERFN